MRQHKAFDIAFVGLKNGVHHFTYLIDNAFFESFSTPDFKDSQLSIHLKMDKKDNFFLLEFEITGNVWVHCDRCGDLFEMDIWDMFPLVVKRVYDLSTVKEEEDDDESIAYIAQNESILNVAKWVYEFALLSIPLQRAHPDDENGNSTCNPEVIEKLENMKRQQEEKENPIWKGLEQFRKK